VLAVGDAAFQNKCVGKMGAVAKEGRTVLFVSHNMAAVQLLCPRGVLLDGGRLILDGDSVRIIDSYLMQAEDTTAAAMDLRCHPNRHRGCQTILSAVRIMNSAGELTSRLYPGDDLILEFDLVSPSAINEPTLGVGVDNAMGARIFSLLTNFSGCEWPKLERATTVRCTVPAVTLVPGRYLMSLSVGNTYNSLMDAITHAASFTVEPNDYFGSGRLPTPELGVLLARSHWDFNVGK
jgi:homopolymeric O-antigen transport system ATP-binding protein